jgi:hypothetical protein
MEWIAFVLAVAAVIYFCIISRAFRIVALGLLVFGVLAGVIGGFIAYNSSLRDEERRAKETSLVSARDLEFENLSIKKPAYSSTSWDVAAVVKNKSSYTVSEITLTVMVMNCVDVETDCTVVGRSDVSDWISIPPGEARMFEATAYLADVPPLKDPKWKYEVKTVRALLNE